MDEDLKNYPLYKGIMTVKTNSFDEFKKFINS